MLANLLLATAFQIGPFYQQNPAENYLAVRPFYASQGDATDVLWPVFTDHGDWWRFCLLMNWQTRSGKDGGYQFSIAPLWFNGRDPEKGAYMGLFPLVGYHPHIAMMSDLKYAMWPLYHSYRMPANRDGNRGWLETQSILFPFISWRSDGAWSFWPFYGVNYQRESDHRYVFWPLVTWADYRSDRDTAGEGYSWMAWPFYGSVRREHEFQDMWLPPFFSYARTWQKTTPSTKVFPGLEPDSVRLRCPWPLFEYERTASRKRISIWPFYENTVNYDYSKRNDDGSRKVAAEVTRFGWKLIELYDDETRVFPFYASGRDHFRLWPFWESETDKHAVTHGRFLSLMPIRWVPAIDRSWSKFWTFYENDSCPLYTDHSLLWGLIRWRTCK